MKSKRTDALASSIADDGTRAQPSRGTALELPMAGRSPNSDEATLFRTGEFQERRAARLQAASDLPLSGATEFTDLPFSGATEF
jgi:hypothetical protein